MRRAGNGGLPARRAVVRWAWRAFRRDARQQALVLALLTFTVAGTLLGIAAGYNAPASQDARFGSADHSLWYAATDPGELEATVDAARAWFGTIDVIGHRNVSVPGLVRHVEMRVQDPSGPYGRSMLRLSAGRFATGPSEIALTEGIVALTESRVGGQVTLDGRTWTVVGIVENPNDLAAEFVLVPPGQAGPSESLTILVVATQERFNAFLARAAEQPVYGEREPDESGAAAAGPFGLAALALFLVCFVAAAGFVAMAQRRTRHFGLLAALGATERHVRLVLLAAGALIGVLAAAIGAAVSIPLWTVVRPRLEVAAGHRIEPLHQAWWLVAAALVLAVVAATGAAWWPARSASRIPIVRALSMRPSPPRPARRSAIMAVVLLAAGVASLRLAHQHSTVLTVAGSILTVIGLPLLTPLAIRMSAAACSRLPVAPRLALRDLARYRARSGAALAAISLALAVPVIVVVTVAGEAAAHDRVAAAGNLSNRHLLLRADGFDLSIVPDRTPAQSAAIEAAVRRFATTLGTPTIIPLDVAIDEESPLAYTAEGAPAMRAVGLGIYARVSDGGGVHVSINPASSQAGPSYIATPELLGYYGVGPLDPGVDGLSVAGDVGAWVFAGTGEALGRGSEPAPATVASMPAPRFSSLPDTLLSPGTVLSRGWRTVRAGWLIDNDRPLTTAQLAAARSVAVDYGLEVEFRDPGSSQARVRAMAIAGGGALALGILAMTVGLIRGEGARDLRTLTATGATSQIRRTLAATTASTLALLGAILAITVVYVALIAQYDTDVGLLRRVPLADLAIIACGVPVTAGIAAWLLAGREPRSLRRIRLD